jgi:hypothetical protein
MQKDELFSKLNDGMLDERYAAFLRNLKKNNNLIKEHGGLKGVVGQFSEKNVIIVGAGSSLGNNFGHLKKIQERESVAIVATDMALRPLVKHKIYPKYVISCETTPRDFFSEVDTSKMNLLAFSCISHSNLKKWCGKIFFYNWMVKRSPFQELWSEAGEDLGFVATGSTVTTQAVAIALGCEIKSLLLVGNDLGYEKKYYVSGGLNDARLFRSIDRFNPLVNAEFSTILKVRHYYFERNQSRYYTSHQFLAAKYWLEDLFKQMDLPVYDASVPGCSGDKIIRVNMDRYIERNISVRSKKRRRR